MHFTKFINTYQGSHTLCGSVLHGCSTQEERATAQHYWETTDRPWCMFEILELLPKHYRHSNLELPSRRAALSIIADYMQPQNTQVLAMLNIYRMHLAGECHLTTALCLSFQRLVCSWGTPNTQGAYLEPFEMYAAQATCLLLQGDHAELCRMVAEGCKWRGVHSWHSWVDMAALIRRQVPGTQITKLIEQI